MFIKPSFAIVSIGLAVSVLIVLIVLSPLNEWWALPFPEATAAYHLEESSWGPDLSGCEYGPFLEWQVLARDSDATARFEEVFQRARFPVGRLHALIGLRAGNESTYAATLDSLRNAGNTDTISVHLRSIDYQQVPLLRLLDSASADLLQTYRDTSARPEC